MAGLGFDTIWAGAGNDVVLDDGTSEGDEVHGEEGNDLIVTGNGNDIIKAGAGNDIVNAQGGDDFIFGEDGDDYIAGGGAGADFIDGGAGDDILSGGDGNDQIIGGDGADFVLGGTGNDVAEGGLGGDFLNGESGDDILDGGEGNDNIQGGAGNDLLTGGLDLDHYHFQAGSGVDRINDFALNEVIVLNPGMNGQAYSSPADMLVRVSQTAEGALIDLGLGNTILLVGVSATQLTDSNFSFVPDPGIQPDRRGELGRIWSRQHNSIGRSERDPAHR